MAPSPAIMEIWVLPPEIDTCGSGKFATPWARMHCANWSALLLLAAVSWGDVEPPAPGLEVPPHAARESPATVKQSRIAYRTVTSLMVVVPQWYAMGGYVTVTRAVTAA